MRASGICYTDVHETLGHIPGPFPRILGHEPVGTGSAGGRVDGDNLHRTVRSVDWWLSKTHPDRAIYDTAQAQLTLWKRVTKG